jgi:hypothetical protein
MQHHPDVRLSPLTINQLAMPQPWEAAAATRDAGDHKEAERLEQLAPDAKSRRRWWRRTAEI